MASSTSSSKAPCATCGNKAVGIFRCEGCLCVFCRKHLNEHRDVLSHQLDEIVLEHDTLQQTIMEDKNKQNKQHPILKEIDKWESDSIVKIRQLAEEARQQVKKMTNSSQTVSKELHDLAERLQKARIDDDYVEKDLRTWTTVLQKLKDDIKSYAPSISVREDQSQIVVGKICVSTITMHHLRQSERFGESFGNIRIENNGLLARHSDSQNGSALVRGTGEYSLGKHYIRFLFIKNDTRFITSFRVISKLMPIINANKSKYYCFGWSSNDNIYGSGAKMSDDEDFLDMIGQNKFEIELQLDCDNRKISYVNQGTKNRREMNVNITQCPFPWQVEFDLFEKGDRVQFLS